MVILHLLPSVEHAVVSQALPIRNPCLLTCLSVPAWQPVSFGV